MLQRATDYVVPSRWDEEWLMEATKLAKEIEDAWERQHSWRAPFSAATPFRCSIPSLSARRLSKALTGTRARDSRP